MVMMSQGPSNTSVAPTASSFGMNDKVISLIWVAAWKILIDRPTTRVTSSNGPAMVSATFMAWYVIDMTVSEFMWLLLLIEASGQGTQQQMPAVRQHEKHKL